MSAMRTQQARSSGWASALCQGLLYALAAGDPNAARHPAPNKAGGA